MMEKCEKRVKLLQKVRRLPLFWSNLILMLCLVILAGAILICSNKLYQRALSERYLSDTRKMLEYNCSNLSENRDHYLAGPYSHSDCFGKSGVIFL